MQASLRNGRAGTVGRPFRAPAPAVVRPVHQQPAGTTGSSSLANRSRTSSVCFNNWKVFGPTADYSDGDADFYALTDRLSQQYPGFAPRGPQPADSEEEGPGPLQQPLEQQRRRTRPEYGLSPKQIEALGLAGPRTSTPDPASLSSKAFIRGEKYDPSQFGYNAAAMSVGRSYTAPRAEYSGGARAAYDYPKYPEGRPLFFPESERYGSPPDLPSTLLANRVIYISSPFLPSVTELVVAQCYYLDFDDRNRSKPIYVYLNSTGCINEQGKAISADNEFYAIWAALGFTRAPLYTGVTWKAQNQAAVLLSAGVKGHRYSFPHAKISTAPPVVNRVFGQTVDAQLQANELVYATKYYAAILARSTGKPLEVCQKEYLSRKRYFTVKEAYEEGLVDKLVPGYSLNRFRKLRKDKFGDGEAFYAKDKPTFRFKRDAAGGSQQ